MTHLTLDYTEITVSDLPRAQAFYGAAFGWDFNDYGGAYAGIRAAAGDGEVGGLAPGEPSSARGAVLPLVRTAGLDAALAAVRGAGGTVVEEPYDYPGGRRFLCADPDGTVLGVYEPAS
jgi:uncharacterized protein